MQPPTKNKEPNGTSSTYTAIRWSAFAKYSAQAIQLVTSLTLANILEPRLFGLLGMAMVFITVGKTLGEMGFHTAIVQRQRKEDESLSTIFWANFFICYAITAVAMNASQQCSNFFGEPELKEIFTLLSLSIIMSSFELVPKAILQRDLEMKSLAIRETVVAIFVSITAISLAVNQFGILSLVIATLAGKLCSIILLNLANPFYPKLHFDLKEFKSVLSFGGGVMGVNLFNQIARSSDNFIIGYFLGPTSLGYYSMAYKLMLFPKTAVTQVVNRVLFPKLSKSQDSNLELTKMIHSACVVIASISFPMMGGLTILAPELTDILLGDRWKPAIPIIMILAPVGAMQSLWSAPTQLMLAKGKAGIYFKWGLANGFLCALSFLAGVPWGITGVAIAYALLCTIWVPATFKIASAIVPELKVEDLGLSLMPYLICTLGMMGIVFLLRLLDLQVLSEAIRLCIYISVGALTYAYLLVKSKTEASKIILKLLGIR